ncbi:MAG: HD domain-containing protein [Synergistaceae bacterium]|jgi:tRNA nucleotidyltransferase (CCA-adding enzyme)|nr:HD domain-containing protein [Synergistaceae bacterium]
MDELEFVRTIRSAHGRVYIVGGWVRDKIRGVSPHDRDYVVTGLTEDVFCSLFDAIRVGAGFPVYRLVIDGEWCDVAFARGERKSGPGYRGFSVSYSPRTTIEEDLNRRDTTINSIALDLETGETIDPFCGVSDIEARVVRATSEHFVEDPVRALRAARQAAQFGFSVDGVTINMMRMCRDEIALEPGERIVNELRRALAGSRPSLFFRYLQSAGILDVVYPQVFALEGAYHLHEHHPEGDAFEHSMKVLDEVARVTARTEVRFAALAHDLGKALTPVSERPHYYGHESLGLDALREWNRRMTLPKRWILCASCAITEHMRALVVTKPGKIVDLLYRIRGNPIGADGFSAIIRADRGHIPEFLENCERYYEVMDRVRGEDAPQNLKGPELGEWIRQRRIEEYRRAAPVG